MDHAKTVVDLASALAAVAAYLGRDADPARMKLAALDPLQVEVLLAEVGSEAAETLTLVRQSVGPAREAAEILRALLLRRLARFPTVRLLAQLNKAADALTEIEQILRGAP